MTAAPDSMRALRDAIAAGESTAAEAIETSLSRIAARNGELNAFRETYDEQAREHAAELDRRISRGERPGSLAGVPIAIKDNIVTAYGRTSCSSRMLEAYRSPYSATVIDRLEQAGAIVVGKTNCDEFAMGSSSEHCAFGAVRNPWSIDRVPGGSSGGSAAAVAADLCPVALGSDTGGSIRQPAGLCGCVGPLARTVGDAALLLSVMAGPDRHDSTSADVDVPDYLATLDSPITDLRIGVPREYLGEQNDAAVNDAVRAAIEVYRGLGAEIVDVELPLTHHGISTYYVIAPAEASSNLARYDGIRYGRRAQLESGEELFDLYARSRAEGFGPEVQRRIMLGTYVLSAGYYDAYYKRALQVRRLIKEELDRAFERCHVLLGPTSPTPAFPLGTRVDPMAMYVCDTYTVNTNIAGICGISIPCGLARTAEAPLLPIGLQLQAKAFDEVTLLRAARMFEAATDHHQQCPPNACPR